MNLNGNNENQGQQIVRMNLPKPYKLDQKNLTLDKLDGWITILKSFAGSDPRYVKFMPGGQRANWTPADEDVTRGLTVLPEYPENPTAEQRQQADDLALGGTIRLRGECQELLSLIGSYSPDGLFRPIVQESSSLAWIIDTIKTTFNLQTRGENLVLGLNMTFNKSSETYQQFYMRLRSFHMESLLPAGTNFKGRALNAAETISPLAEAMIVNMWLSKIDHRLPNHVKSTKNFLFTPEKPTLACVQPQLAVMLDTMLAELDNDGSANRVSLDSATPTINRLFSTPRPYNQARPPFSGNNYRYGRAASSFRGNRGSATRGGGQSQTSRRDRLCTKCYGAGKDERIYSSHDTNSCFVSTGGASRVRYITIPVEEWQDYPGQEDINCVEQQEFIDSNEQEFEYQTDQGHLQQI